MAKNGYRCSWPKEFKASNLRKQFHRNGSVLFGFVIIMISTWDLNLLNVWHGKSEGLIMTPVRSQLSGKKKNLRISEKNLGTMQKGVNKRPRSDPLRPCRGRDKRQVNGVDVFCPVNGIARYILYVYVYIYTCLIGINLCIDLQSISRFFFEKLFVMGIVSIVETELLE